MIYTRKRTRPSRAVAGLSIGMLALYAGTAVADDGNSIYKFNAFGTLGLTHASEKKADFTSVVTRPSGAGFTRSWSPAVDSRLAAQVSAEFDSHWSAVLQVMSEQNWDKTYTPHVEWANVKYAFSPDFSVRVGRITVPNYLFSSTRKIGYSIPWVRPAAFFYSLAPLSNSDGVDASYRFHVGEASNTITAFVSRGYSFTAADRTPQGSRIKFHSLESLVDKIEVGDLTLQFAYLQGRSTVAKLAALPVPSLARLGDHTPYRSKFIGFDYDPGNFFVIGELGEDSAPSLGRRRGGYLSVGYRIGQWTPYLMYETNKQVTPGPLVPPSDLNSKNIGVRWDVYKNVAIKAQYDHLSLGKGAAGPVVNRQPDFVPGRSNDIISFTVDFAY